MHRLPFCHLALVVNMNNMLVAAVQRFIRGRFTENDGVPQETKSYFDLFCYVDDATRAAFLRDPFNVEEMLGYVHRYQRGMVPMMRHLLYDWMAQHGSGEAVEAVVDASSDSAARDSAMPMTPVRSSSAVSPVAAQVQVSLQPLAPQIKLFVNLPYAVDPTNPNFIPRRLCFTNVRGSDGALFSRILEHCSKHVPRDAEDAEAQDSKRELSLRFHGLKLDNSKTPSFYSMYDGCVLDLTVTLVDSSAAAPSSRQTRSQARVAAQTRGRVVHLDPDSANRAMMHVFVKLPSLLHPIEFVLTDATPLSEIITHVTNELSLAISLSDLSQTSTGPVQYQLMARGRYIGREATCESAAITNGTVIFILPRLSAQPSSFSSSSSLAHIAPAQSARGPSSSSSRTGGGASRKAKRARASMSSSSAASSPAAPSPRWGVHQSTSDGDQSGSDSESAPSALQTARARRGAKKGGKKVNSRAGAGAGVSKKQARLEKPRHAQGGRRKSASEDELSEPWRNPLVELKRRRTNAYTGPVLFIKKIAVPNRIQFNWPHIEDPDKMSLVKKKEKRKAPPSSSSSSSSSSSFSTSSSSAFQPVARGRASSSRNRTATPRTPASKHKRRKMATGHKEQDDVLGVGAEVYYGKRVAPGVVAESKVAGGKRSYLVDFGTSGHNLSWYASNELMLKSPPGSKKKTRAKKNNLFKFPLESA